MPSQSTLSRIGISKILLVTDFSPESQNALQCALALARRHEAKLCITHVLPVEASTTAGDTWPPLEDMPRRNAEARMAQLEKREDLRSFPHEVIMRPGDTWDGIPQIVSDQEVDLVVMDTP